MGSVGVWAGHRGSGQGRGQVAECTTAVGVLQGHHVLGKAHLGTAHLAGDVGMGQDSQLLVLRLWN